MDIEKMFNLKEILVTDENEQYVIITTKRNFLNSDSSLYVKPRYVKIKDILSTINTETVVKNIIKNMELMEQKLSEKDCNYQRIEERMTAGILIKRDKYDALYEMTKFYTEQELLNTDVINSSILTWGIHNVIHLSPYMMRYNKQDDKYEMGYAVAEPSNFVNIQSLYNNMISQGYRIDMVKSSTDILRENITKKEKDPYQALCSLILSNQGIYTDGIKRNYNTDLIISQNNNSRANKPLRFVRKR